MLIRPRGLWVGDRFEYGLEVEVVEGRPVSWRTTTRAPEPVWLSPAFVNAHSHLEYRLFLGEIRGAYWEWLRTLTQRKFETPQEAFRESCRMAARENRTTGVGLIAEHADTVFSGPALAEVGIRGWVMQELITFAEQNDPEPKREAVRLKLAEHKAATPDGSGLKFGMTPHAPWTVEDDSLRQFASAEFVSIHVAEHPVESEFFQHGTGPIAELYRARGFPLRTVGASSEDHLLALGLGGENVQVVHGCAWQEGSAAWARRLAWCPRSNVNLGCPPAPLHRFDQADLGLGLDSAASSGRIDFFEELRCAAHSPERRQAGFSEDRLWAIATTEGARSIGYEAWGRLETGQDDASWIAIESDVNTVSELIAQGKPEQVRWL